MFKSTKKVLAYDAVKVKKANLGLFLLTILLGFFLVGGCGGGDGDNMGDGDNDPGPGIQTRVVTGTVSEGVAKNVSPRAYKAKSFASYVFDSIAPESALAAGQAGTFIVTAVARDGSVHEVDTDPMSGEFMLDLPIEECYTMSFTAHTGPGMMDEFHDFMVFECGPEHMGEFDDQFCLSDGDGPVDLGEVTVHSDHSFAMPMHNPLEEVDFDADGNEDFHDPDYVCGNVEDADHDGYYDDDMDHDGFHDDDMDHDGFHDGDMDHDGFHDGGDMHRDDFHHDDQMGGGGMM